ncbi:unnamed protein product [Strongylus vulgaris]|uniref:Uncharacterized protein n=1 Tax=Strongylus vulgaris TaxID=40348 RepID=A0A3P7JMR7_STRVU|nr:unnamed protein product [Strongylus vulgaris]
MDTNKVWMPKKRHFRETEEWRVKKSRVLSKMRALTRMNLLLVLSKMSFCRKHSAVQGEAGLKD